MTNLSLPEVLAAIAELSSTAAAPTTIAVCDLAGDLIYLGRADGAPGFSAEFAAGKAYTAARFGNTTSQLEADWAQRPVFAHSLLTQGKWFVGRGGIPVKRAGQVVGAVGVSGADAAGEEQIALDLAANLSTEG